MAFWGDYMKAKYRRRVRREALSELERDLREELDPVTPELLAEVDDPSLRSELSAGRFSADQLARARRHHERRISELNTRASEAMRLIEGHKRAIAILEVHAGDE